MEADVRELIEDALVIRCTFQKDAAGTNAEAGSIEELVKSAGVVG